MCVCVCLSLGLLVSWFILAPTVLKSREPKFDPLHGLSPVPQIHRFPIGIYKIHLMLFKDILHVCDLLSGFKPNLLWLIINLHVANSYSMLFCLG